MASDTSPHRYLPWGEGFNVSHGDKLVLMWLLHYCAEIAKVVWNALCVRSASCCFNASQVMSVRNEVKFARNARTSPQLIL